MQRHSFVQEKALRPKVLFREYLVEEGIWDYMGHIHRSKCHLTVYRKADMILAIAHETPENKGLNLGDGARYFWKGVKESFEANSHICIQGHNGYYEYVEVFPQGKGYMGDAKWSPAGTLQEVLERHLG